METYPGSSNRARTRLFSPFEHRTKSIIPPSSIAMRPFRAGVCIRPYVSRCKPLDCVARGGERQIETLIAWRHIQRSTEVRSTRLQEDGVSTVLLGSILRSPF